MAGDPVEQLVPKRRAAQVFRRALQLSVVGFITYAAIGGAFRNYKLAHNHRRIVALIKGDFWGTLYGWNEDFLSLLGEPFRMSFNFIGFPWAGRVLGLDTVDPLLVAGQAVTRGVDMSAGLLLALIIPVGLAVGLGRIFCSHLCPMRLLFDIGQGVRSGLMRLGLNFPEFRSTERFGGFVLVGGLIATAVAGSAVWLFILPYAALSASVFLAITTGAVSVLATVTLLWFVIDLAVAPGFFCHNLCPTGFLLENVGRWSRFRVRARSDRGACPTNCDQCERACPFALSPKEEVPMLGCDNCGNCVVACPRGKLSRGFATAAIAVVALVATAPIAEAHHNKGLPHYGYFDNYPQVPVEEYVAIDGPWEIGAVVFNFQGLDRRTADTPNDVKIYLYLYDDRTQAAYEGPLRVELRQGGEVVSSFGRLAVDEEAVYSTRETLPHGGDFQLVAIVGDEEVTLPIYVEIAGDGVAWKWVGGAVALALLLALAHFGRSRARPKRPRKSDRRVRWAT